MKSIVEQIWDAQDRILTVNFAETAGHLSFTEIETRSRCKRLLEHFERAYPEQWADAQGDHETWFRNREKRLK